MVVEEGFVSASCNTPLGFKMLDCIQPPDIGLVKAPNSESVVRFISTVLSKQNVGTAAASPFGYTEIPPAVVSLWEN